MQMQPVESKLLRAVGYDPGIRTLQVQFTSGAVYQYFDVPPETYEGLRQAESHGRYFLANIRDAYPYSRVGRRRR